MFPDVPFSCPTRVTRDRPFQSPMDSGSSVPAQLVPGKAQGSRNVSIQVVSTPRVLDIIIVLIIVVVLVVALGYSSQFLALLNAKAAVAAAGGVELTDMQVVFRSMSTAVIVITVLMLVAILAGFIASAVQMANQPAPQQQYP